MTKLFARFVAFGCGLMVLMWGGAPDVQANDPCVGGAPKDQTCPYPAGSRNPVNHCFDISSTTPNAKATCDSCARWRGHNVTVGCDANNNTAGVKCGTCVVLYVCGLSITPAPQLGVCGEQMCEWKPDRDPVAAAAGVGLCKEVGDENPVLVSLNCNVCLVQIVNVCAPPPPPPPM